MKNIKYKIFKKPKHQKTDTSMKANDWNTIAGKLADCIVVIAL